MDNIKNIATGTIITILIGGTAYTVSQTDIARNFADDTGLTQEQAEQYVNEISEDELASWDQVGAEFITIGQELVNAGSEIDCVNYEYEWESTTISCFQGKTQIEKLGRDSLLLGQAYIKLSSDSASKDDIRKTIELIDQLNFDYQFEIVGILVDQSSIDDSMKINSYNKAVLKTALESN